MKRTTSWLREHSARLFFYGSVFVGSLIFADLKTSIGLTLLLIFSNGLLRLLVGRLLEGESGLVSLTIRSLLSLGFFPLIWLACRLAGSRWPFLPVILIAAGYIFSLAARKAPEVKTIRNDGRQAVLVLVLVVALTVIPFSRIGYPLQGKFAYRAYFSSDYLKHFSVVESLNQDFLPPPNLYFLGQPLHYYWLPYALPASLACLAGSTPKALFAFSFAVNFLFLLMLWALGQKMFFRRKGTSFWPLLFILTPSLEGFYIWAGQAHFSFHQFFQIGRNTNIDGLTRWLWNLPQIDTLFRALLYTPQHLLSLAFLVLFLYLISSNKERPWFISICLALSLAASFFVGGILLIGAALSIAGREIFSFVLKKQSFKNLAVALIRYFLFPLLILALSFKMKMVAFEGAGISFKSLTADKALLLIGLNFGFLSLTGIGGLLWRDFPQRAVYVSLLSVSLFLIFFVQIDHFESDISLKAGMIVLLLLAVLTSRWGDNLKARTNFFPLLAVLIIVPGLLTLVLDIKNSGDTENRRFTSYVSFEEMQMLQWISHHLPAGRTVQNYPPARTWNLSAIPAFSGRQMVVGDRMHGQIFQISSNAYEERIDALGRALAGLPASKDQLRGLGADYLFWGEDETRHFKFVPDLPLIKKLGRTYLFSVGNP